MKSQASVARMPQAIQARGPRSTEDRLQGGDATEFPLAAQLRAILCAEDPSAPREIVLAAYFDRPPEAIEADAIPDGLELGELAELGVVGPEHEANLLL